MSDMFMNFSVFMAQEARSQTVFGVDISRLDVAGLVQSIVVDAPGARPPGARVFVAARARDIALMQRDPELREAMERADVVTCGGLPLQRYAQFRGYAPPAPVTARAVVDELLHHTRYAPGQRLFFLLDRAETAVAVRTWAAARDVRVEVALVPERTACRTDWASLADRVAAFDATLLFLGVDAPVGAVFAAQSRMQLPEGCWALCVGDAIAGALGVHAAPVGVVGAISRPWRLVRNTCGDTLGFARAIYRDLNVPVQACGGAVKRGGGTAAGALAVRVPLGSGYGGTGG